MKRITVAVLAHEFMTPEIGRTDTTSPSPLMSRPGDSVAQVSAAWRREFVDVSVIVTTRDRPNQLAVLLLGVWQVPNAAGCARSLVLR
jgi:hypothetical protein